MCFIALHCALGNDNCFDRMQDVVYSIACMDANQRAVELKGYTDKEVR